MKDNEITFITAYQRRRSDVIECMVSNPVNVQGLLQGINVTSIQYIPFSSISRLYLLRVKINFIDDLIDQITKLVLRIASKQKQPTDYQKVINLPDIHKYNIHYSSLIKSSLLDLQNNLNKQLSVNCKIVLHEIVMNKINSSYQIIIRI